MSVQDEAFETVRAWWQAWVEKDLDTVASLTDPHYSEHTLGTLVRPIAFGQLLEEASRFCQEVSITEWSLFEPVVKTFGSTAVCSYGFRIVGRYGNREFAFKGWATDVLARRNDAWIYLSHRGTLEGTISRTTRGLG